MRIDKVVRLKLRKFEPRISTFVSDDTQREQVGAEFDAWIYDLMDEFFGDPNVDLIASKMGTTVDDLMNRLNPAFVFNLRDDRWDPTVSGEARPQGITMRIPTDVFENDRKGYVQELLYHEFSHLADMYMNTDEFMPVDYESWMTSPDEQDAMKATIADMMNMGYTDTQIAGLFLEEYNYLLENQPPEDTKFFLKIIRKLIGEVKAEEPLMVSR